VSDDEIDRTHTIAYQRAVRGLAPPPDEIRRLRVHGTPEECRAAGMKPWDESGLLLMPGAWADAVPDDVIVTSIRGETAPMGEIRSEERPGWDDTRYDLLAFGWVPKGGGT
jgi:hypothetical protein